VERSAGNHSCSAASVTDVGRPTMQKEVGEFLYIIVRINTRLGIRTYRPCRIRSGHRAGMSRAKRGIEERGQPVRREHEPLARDAVGLRDISAAEPAVL